MDIVCGTDFSQRSISHCHDAAALARAAKGRLVLVHAVPIPLDPTPGTDGGLQQMIDSATTELRRIAQQVRDANAIEVVERVEAGSTDELITAAARSAGTAIIVVSATSRPRTRWLLGSTTDRVASVAESPIFVMREGFPAQEWLGGARPLRVMVATDLSPVSDGAIAWAAQLSEFGECTYVVAHVSWPPEVYRRLAIEDPMPLDRTHPVVDRVIRRALERSAERLRKAGPCEIVLESSFGRPADALNRLAADAAADVLVVGHHADRLWSAWEGSVARSVIRTADVTVVCVPDRVELSSHVEPRPFRHVVVATDLSRTANDAIAYALSAAPAGGRLTVLHVAEDEESRESAQKALRTVVDAYAARDVTIDIAVVSGDDASRAICAYAEREGADLICIATTGRSRLPRMLLGSVAQEVLLTSRTPVLVVPAMV